MLFELKKLLGHRLKLESIARPTLGTGKSADGMQALKLYKEGKLDKIIEYKGKVIRIISDIRDGLRSSFSYVGADNLLDFQAKCKFVRTT